MILFISTSGESLDFARRCREEGTDIRYYLHAKRHRRNFDGILTASEKIGISSLKESVNKAEVVFFDILRENRRSIQDLELLKLFGLPANSESVFGPVADKIKRHTMTMGASSLFDKWEFNREEGFKIAKMCGIELPEYEKFTSIKVGQDFLRGRADKKWWLKPYGHQDMSFTFGERKPGGLIEYLEEVVLPQVNGDNFEFVLQENIDGHMISCQRRWNGEKWGPIEYTVEDKRFMTGDKGKNVGSANNFVWVEEETEGLLLADAFNHLTPIVKANGILIAVDFNIIVSKVNHKPYLLEITPREGYDAFYNEMNLLTSSYSKFITNRFEAQWYNGFSASCRISISPYPEEGKEIDGLLDKAAKGVRIFKEIKHMPWFWAEDVKYNKKGKLVCAGSDGILGVVTGRGKTIQETADQVYDNIAKLESEVTADLQYRTDLPDRTMKLLNAFKRWDVKVM